MSSSTIWASLSHAPRRAAASSLNTRRDQIGLTKGRPKLQLDLVKFFVKGAALTRREVEQRLVAIGQPPMSPAMIAEVWPEQAP
jgi:hypothetical protein